MFVLIARLCRRRSVEQVRAMMPPPETVEAAVQRVKRAVRFPLCSGSFLFMVWVWGSQRSGLGLRARVRAGAWSVLCCLRHVVAAQDR